MDRKRSDDAVWSKVVMNIFQYIGSTLDEDITSDADIKKILAIAIGHLDCWDIQRTAGDVQTIA